MQQQNMAKVCEMGSWKRNYIIASVLSLVPNNVFDR